MVSVQQWGTPMIGLSRSSRLKPMLSRNERAAARSMPW